MRRKGVCLLGYGETPYARPKGGDPKSYLRYMTEAVKAALDNAGLKKKDINGFAVHAGIGWQEDSPFVAEHLGLDLDWIMKSDFGGASGVYAIRRAADAIQLGEIEVAVIAAGDVFLAGPGAGLPSIVGVSYQDAFGWGGPNSRFGMIQRRYMLERGVTLEQLGKFALAFRRNAELNEHAMQRTPLTIEDYLGSRMISDPVRLFDCCMPCSGGGAIVLTSERKAKEHTEHPVYLVGDAEKTNYMVSEGLPDETIMGFKSIAEELFSAGVGRDEIDVFQIYDDYPVAVPITLESLGFIERDKVGGFIDSHDFTFEGDFPINTSGGQLSQGQAGLTGGILGVVEAMSQLKGEAGVRQVKGAKTALITGIGTFSYVHTLACYGAMILQRR